MLTQGMYILDLFSFIAPTNRVRDYQLGIQFYECLDTSRTIISCRDAMSKSTLIIIFRAAIIWTL